MSHSQVQSEMVEGYRRVMERARVSIEFFASYFFPNLVYKGMAQFHREIYADLIAHPFYACAAPRGHAKSTIGLVINSMHYALFRKVGDITLLSASEDFIINEIVRVIKREFETNERLKFFFGEVKTSKWSETYFVIKHPDGTHLAFEAGGIGGQLRGGRRGLICLDDLESNESVESEDQREKLRNRVNKELIPKLLPGGQMAYFGTIISPLCYLKQILDGENSWFKRIYRAYPDGIEEKGHELWTEMMPHEELQRRKNIMGTNAFMSEYMNNPISDSTAAIKDNMIRYWDELPTQMSVVMTIDPAYSEDSKADYKVCAVIGTNQNMSRYLVSYIRTRDPQGEFIDAVLNTYIQYQDIITGLGVPKGAGDSEFFNSLTRRAQERNVNPPFITLKNTFITGAGEAKRNKKARCIAALQPLFESGKYYIHRNHQEAKEELLQLNPVTDQMHDDLIDAMAYAEQIIQPVYFDMGQSVNDDSDPAMVGRSANYGMD